MPPHKRELVLLNSPLWQDAFELSPAFQQAFAVSNEIDWTFAVLMGRNAGKQIPLECDGDGRLLVETPNALFAEMYSQLNEDTTPDGPWYDNNISGAASARATSVYTSAISGKLTSTNDDVDLADYFDATEKNEPFWHSGFSIGEFLSGQTAYSPLNDGNSKTVGAHFNESSQCEPFFIGGYSAAYYLQQIHSLLYAVVASGGASSQVRIDTIS